MIRLVAVAALLTTLASASPAWALTVRDMLGREVTLSALPTRIVSLVPHVTETIFALGAEDRLVGRTDFCEYPAAARGKPSVGGMVNPSLEALVALKPDLVVATDEGNREETFQQLARLRIPTYLVHATRLSALRDMIARLGDLTGHQAAVAPLTDALTRRVEDVRRRVAPFPRPRVLYVIWPEPLIVPGRPSLLTELIEVAGGESVTSGESQPYVRFSVEAAVARAPEVIVLADHSAGTSSTAGRPAPEQWQRFSSVPAIRAGRLHSVDLSILHRYGPSVVDGLESLARVIHPEAFR
ncbi:MAG: cobalamin-binding protein [Candidatus Rokuibacteriota bacterium]|nr:MAG: cobalamin-binding protein [Candidatus Rokubacteria bacterium]